MQTSDQPHLTSPEQDFLRWRRVGDAAALGRVFDRLAPELLLVAGHVAARGSAEDLVQTVFLRAIEGAERWDPARPLMPWLVGILVRLSLRDRARGARERDRTSGESANELVTHDAPPLAAEREEVAQAVAAALADLPITYRQALTLRLVHGLQPAAIAHALGVPPDTIKSRLRRGLERLRRALPTGMGAPALLVYTPRDLDAVRSAVMARGAARAAIVQPAAAVGAAALGGVALMSKSTLVAACLAAVALVSGVLYWSSTLAPDDDGPSPALAADLDPSGAPATPARDPSTASSRAREAVAAVADGSTPDSPASLSADVPAAARLEGRVLDAGRLPLPGVTVVLADTVLRSFSDEARFLDTVNFESGLSRWHDEEGVTVTTTDEHGRFAFEAPTAARPHLVGAWAPDRGGRARLVTGETEGAVEIVLPIDGLVSGVVREDVHGAALAQAKVSVWPARSGYPIAGASTDPSGHYVLPRLPPGDYRTEVRHGEHASRSGSFTLPPGTAELAHDVTLSPLPQIDLQLIDRAGVPWTRERMERACPDDRTPDGRWAALLTERVLGRLAELELETSETMPLALDERGRLTGTSRLPDHRTLSVWRSGEKLFEALGVDHTAHELAVELLPPSGAWIEVEIAFDPPAEGLTAVTVSLTDPSGYGNRGDEPIVVQETESARCALRIPRQFLGARCGVMVEAAERATMYRIVDVPHDGIGASCRVTLVPATGALRGVVVGPDGAPVPNARLFVAAADGGPLVVQRAARRDASLDGTFAIERLPACAVRVFVSAPECAWRAFELDTRVDEPVRLELRAPNTLRVERQAGVEGVQVRVLDAAGAPLYDQRLSGGCSYGGGVVALDPDAVTVEVYDAQRGVLVGRGAVPAAGPLVLEPPTASAR